MQLDSETRIEAARALAKRLFEGRTATLALDELTALVGAADEAIEEFRDAIEATIPDPYKDTLTSTEKIELFSLVASVKAKAEAQ